MKLTKKIILIINLLLMCLITSCIGINPNTKNHLSKRESYSTYIATVKSRPFMSDYKTGWRSDIPVYFETIEDVAKFKNVEIESLGSNPTSYTFYLEVVGENVIIVKENSFLEEVTAGDKLTITVSNYEVGQKSYFFIIELSNAEKIYLDSEIGLPNTIFFLDSQ